MLEPSDRSLIAAARRGDAAAFDELEQPRAARALRRSGAIGRPGKGRSS